MGMDNKPTASSQATGHFLNGRAQVVELLQVLGPEEKLSLLKNLKLRNPQLAQELSKESLSFEEIQNFSEGDLRVLMGHVPSTVMGVALKGLPVIFQKRLLSLASRGYAEEAFTTMTSSLTDEYSSQKKAREKVLGIILGLSQRKQISFI